MGADHFSSISRAPIFCDKFPVASTANNGPAASSLFLASLAEISFQFAGILSRSIAKQKATASLYPCSPRRSSAFVLRPSVGLDPTEARMAATGVYPAVAKHIIRAKPTSWGQLLFHRTSLSHREASPWRADRCTSCDHPRSTDTQCCF